MPKQSRAKNNADSVGREFALFICGTVHSLFCCALNSLQVLLSPPEKDARNSVPFSCVRKIVTHGLTKSKT